MSRTCHRQRSDERRETRGNPGGVLRRGEAPQPLGGFVSRQILDDAGGFPNRLGDRPVRQALAVREAATAQNPRLRGHQLAELRDEPRLPDAGLAEDRGHAASALLDDGPEVAALAAREADRGPEPELPAPRPGGLLS